MFLQLDGKTKKILCNLASMQPLLAIVTHWVLSFISIITSGSGSGCEYI
jgi:hypothetical protein